MVQPKDTYLFTISAEELSFLEECVRFLQEYCQKQHRGWVDPYRYDLFKDKISRCVNLLYRLSQLK